MCRNATYNLPCRCWPRSMLAAVCYRTVEVWRPHASWTPVLLLLLIPVVGGFWKADLIHLSPDSRALMCFLRSCPDNGLIAANPGIASTIPALARRSVLVSHEGYLPFHRTYFREMKTRLKDWLSAYYATEPAALLALLNRYPVRWMVVDVNDYEAHRRAQLPKNSYRSFPADFFREWTHGGDKNRYLSYWCSQSHAAYRNNTYLVVSAASLRSCLNAQTGRLQTGVFGGAEAGVQQPPQFGRL